MYCLIFISNIHLHSLLQRRLPCCRAPGSSQQSICSSPTARPAMEFGVHAIQPWFYSGMSRDEATLLLTKYGTVDG